MAFVRDNGFAGAMIWELGQDHWDASNLYDNYSLLPVFSSMIRPPAWLSPAVDSRFDLVAQTFYLHSGTVTATADASGVNPNLNVNVAGGTTFIIGATQHLAGLT